MSRVKFVLLKLFVFILVTAAIYAAGNSYLLYLDGLTFIMIPVLPYLIASFIYPFGDQRVIYGAVFSKEKSPDTRTLKMGLEFFKLIRRLMFAAALLATIIGFIGILAHMGSTEDIAGNFGVAFITLFYLSLFLLMIIEPLIAITKKRMIETDN